MIFYFYFYFFLLFVSVFQDEGCAKGVGELTKESFIITELDCAKRVGELTKESCMITELDLECRSFLIILLFALYLLLLMLLLVLLDFFFVFFLICDIYYIVFTIYWNTVLRIKGMTLYILCEALRSNSSVKHFNLSCELHLFGGKS